ncbi:helix-turn-helix domain-containing protein [Leptobacterium flavescens]|uniref:Helix-turn-helix domain-containing protein n=1 Tax=Leptobacterium flavescens TaxID=472055 RepID=A0A6P0UPL3_9FLAO|nr:helix-turn-helix domain-containing protein [Leptobacterium flavescens]NER15271.1 helix-turn-helix domain-containing protein [Leptobacterium flavescens]
MTAISMIINVLIAYGTCQAFFIAFIILRSDRTLFKKLFAALLIIEGITLFERFLVETDLITSVPHLLGISNPISFIKPPLMLFMAMAITIHHFKLIRKHYWHFIVFAFMLLLNLPFYFLSGTEKIETVEVFMNKIPSYSSFEFYFTLSFFAYIGVYIYISIKKLREFKKQVTNNALVNWLHNVLLGYSLFLVLHLIYFAIQPIGKYNFALINQISMLAMAFIIQSIAFKIIDKSTIFNSKPPNLKDPLQRKKDENIILDKLENGKVYLNDNLNLTTFSRSVELSSAYVSEIINQKFNCSFKKLLNHYRLEEAKKNIHKNKDNKIKLIDIAFQSGFNNKVSFYRVFKEIEGISPSEYLEKIKKA